MPCYCECGCGKMYPQNEMVEIQTGYPDHPVELVYEPHARKVYGLLAIPRGPGLKRP